MRKGKIAAQCAHASMKVLLNRMPRLINRENPEIAECSRTLYYTSPSPMSEWIDGQFAKICVYVSSEKELDDLAQKAKEAKIVHAMIVDSGRTEFHGVPTKTVLAIGPAWSSAVDEITSHLPLL